MAAELEERSSLPVMTKYILTFVAGSVLTAAIGGALMLQDPREMSLGLKTLITQEAQADLLRAMLENNYSADGHDLSLLPLDQVSEIYYKNRADAVFFRNSALRDDGAKIDIMAPNFVVIEVNGILFATGLKGSAQNNASEN